MINTFLTIPFSISWISNSVVSIPSDLNFCGSRFFISSAGRDVDEHTNPQLSYTYNGCSKTPIPIQ